MDHSYAMEVPGRGSKLAQCSRIGPTHLGTRVAADYYWLCGHKAYPSLPPQWGGLCALVSLSDHVFFMPAESFQHPSNGDGPQTRKRRDTVSTSLADPVPMQYRIWGAGAKFGQSILPQVGLGFIRDHVEVNRYALLRHINATLALGHGLANEQTQIRDMVMQNRIVLDLLTGSQGGVCAVIGQTCCTYIPDGMTDGGDIYQALQNLTDLQSYVLEQTPGADPLPDWVPMPLGEPATRCVKESSHPVREWVSTGSLLQHIALEIGQVLQSLVDISSVCHDVRDVGTAGLSNNCTHSSL
uniref:Uncharacterized protein n=1 Tax=Sparus aurata TaxID=8175 RepID=A0A671TNK6_SPAAU